MTLFFAASPLVDNFDSNTCTQGSLLRLFLFSLCRVLTLIYHLDFFVQYFLKVCLHSTLKLLFLISSTQVEVKPTDKKVGC